MRDIFIKDLGWKLFSLSLAVIIWVTVHKILHEPNTDAAADTGGISSVTYGDLPVQIVSATADVSDFQVKPKTVKVTINGPSEIIDQLRADQVHAVVNLTDADPGRDLHQAVEVSAPSGVTITNIDPATVFVIFPPPAVKK
jgi:YbbR domain-containing protein